MPAGCWKSWCVLVVVLPSSEIAPVVVWVVAVAAVGLKMLSSSESEIEFLLTLTHDDLGEAHACLARPVSVRSGFPWRPWKKEKVSKCARCVKP